MKMPPPPPRHRLIGSDAIRRCGLVEVAVALFEEVCPWK